MKRSLIGLSLTFGLISISNPVIATETDALSGFIGFGAIVINSANNLNPDGSERRLQTLDSGADRETTGLGLIVPRINWDIGEQKGMVLYLQTDPPIDEVGGFAFNLGGAYHIPDIGVIDASLFIAPFQEAWENPYLTGVDREETDNSKYGARIGFNRILNSGLRVSFLYLNDDVDNDLIGRATPLLARDGVVYSLDTNYSFHPTENLELRPGISIRKGDYDGEANSFIKFKFEFATRYTFDKLMVAPKIHYSYSEYDETHPIFDTTRDNNSYGFSLRTSYMAPFNWKNWSVMALLSLSRGDSNIDFYDTESISFGGFLNYHF